MITKFNRNKLQTRNQMARKNKAEGHYWFTPETLRFFDGRIESSSNEYGLFVTSEQFHDHRGNSEPRRYTVRQFRHDTGQVETVGEFQEYASFDGASRAVAELTERAEGLSTLDLQNIHLMKGGESYDGVLALDGMIVGLDNDR